MKVSPHPGDNEPDIKAKKTNSHGKMAIIRRLLRNWKFLLVVLLPLVLLPMIAVKGKEIRCAYMLIIMATFWITEALPVAVTALLPIIMAPLLGITSAREISPNYANDTIFLFFGGLTVAICVEHWNFHRRIATRMLMLVGITKRWLMLGFMFPTWFLSMWISNTATTAMMIPITAAVLKQIEEATLNNQEAEIANSIDPQGGEAMRLENKDEISDDKTIEINQDGNQEMRAQHDKFCKAMCLAIAYSANCGGIATLTGTAPNLVLVGQLDKLFGDVSVNFMTWMVFAFPISLLSMLTCWVWLVLFFLGPRSLFSCKTNFSSSDEHVKEVLRNEYRKLGKMSYPEWVIFISFVLLVLLWITRVSEFFPGWATLFNKGYVSDGTAAMIIALLMFLLPSSIIKVSPGSKPPPPIMDWEVLVRKMPWGIILLLGGGFAIAQASKESGLSEYVGAQLSVLEGLPPPVIVLCVSTLIAAITEVSSNTATTALMLPILAAMARNMQMNPLYLMLPGTVAASFAFMLPVATPPNAVVFAYGALTIKDMVKAGFVMNIICVLYVTLATTTWGAAYFQLNELPAWAFGVNATKLV